MGQCFLYGNGGNVLPYDLVCQTATPSKKEGRIWIKSSVAATQLFTRTPQSGDRVGTVVIIGTGGGYAPSSSNTTLQLVYKKINGVTHDLRLNPTGCKQVQGSAGNWVNVDAYVCHSGTWVQFSSAWDGTLFNNGNQYTSATGGWTGADSYSPNLTATLYSGTITISTVSAVDLSSFSTLKFTGSGNGANSGGTYAAKCKIVNESGVEVASADFQNNGTYSVSVSGLSGKHYVRFTANGSRGNNLDISKVWLE